MIDRLIEARRRNVSGIKPFYSHGKPIAALYLEGAGQPYRWGRLKITDEDGDTFLELDRDGKIVGGR